MQIQILGTGCAKCRQLEANARKALQVLDVDAEVIKVTEIAEITEYNVMMTPALAINRQVKVSGRVADPKQIMEWIKEARGN